MAEGIAHFFCLIIAIPPPPHDVILLNKSIYGTADGQNRFTVSGSKDRVTSSDAPREY